MNRSKFPLLTATFVAAASFFSATRGVSAEPDAAAGTALLKRYADAIVGVEMVVTVKVRMGEREAPPREQRIDINGTVLSPDGLTVTSLAEVDPQTLFEAMRASQTGPRVELVSADFKEVKLRLADGTEVPARIVLKDADLDLAFMAPEIDAPKREFPYVKLEDSVDGAVLADYFYVARAPKSLQRTPMIRASRIMGVVEKPRRFYLATEQILGTPLFSPAGKILGISVQHFGNGRRTGLVVVPAGDIAEMAQQAAAVQVKAPEAAAKTESAAPAEPAKN
jgi:hypothetical protein